MKSIIRLILILAFLLWTLSGYTQNVGIGTSTPLQKLNIATSSGYNLLIENLNTLSAGIHSSITFACNANSANSYRYTGAIKSIGNGNNTARMGFFTYASDTPADLNENLTILDNGNVGISETNPGYRLEVNGTGNITGDLTVNNGKGIMRSVNGTQLKCYSRDAGFAITLAAFGSFESNIGFTTGIFNSPPRVFVGDVVSGTGEFERLRIVAFDVTANNCKVRLYNESNATISVNAVWSIICIGN